MIVFIFKGIENYFWNITKENLCFLAHFSKSFRGSWSLRVVDGNNTALKVVISNFLIIKMLNFLKVLAVSVNGITSTLLERTSYITELVNGFKLQLYCTKQEEANDMFKVGAVVSGTSAWYFSVPISTEKNGKLCVCVEYETLNRAMKVA